MPPKSDPTAVAVAATAAAVKAKESEEVALSSSSSPAQGGVVKGKGADGEAVVESKKAAATSSAPATPPPETASPPLESKEAAPAETGKTGKEESSATGKAASPVPAEAVVGTPPPAAGKGLAKAQRNGGKAEPKAAAEAEGSSVAEGAAAATTTTTTSSPATKAAVAVKGGGASAAVDKAEPAKGAASAAAGKRVEVVAKADATPASSAPAAEKAGASSAKGSNSNSVGGGGGGNSNSNSHSHSHSNLPAAVEGKSAAAPSPKERPEGTRPNSSAVVPSPDKSTSSWVSSKKHVEEDESKGVVPIPDSNVPEALRHVRECFAPLAKFLERIMFRLGWINLTVSDLYGVLQANLNFLVDTMVRENGFQTVAWVLGEMMVLTLQPTCGEDAQSIVQAIQENSTLYNQLYAVLNVDYLEEAVAEIQRSAVRRVSGLRRMPPANNYAGSRGFSSPPSSFAHGAPAPFGSPHHHHHHHLQQQQQQPVPVPVPAMVPSARGANPGREDAMDAVGGYRGPALSMERAASTPSAMPVQPTPMMGGAAPAAVEGGGSAPRPSALAHSVPTGSATPTAPSGAPGALAGANAAPYGTGGSLPLPPATTGPQGSHGLAGFQDPPVPHPSVGLHTSPPMHHQPPPPTSQAPQLPAPLQPQPQVVVGSASTLESGPTSGSDSVSTFKPAPHITASRRQPGSSSAPPVAAGILLHHHHHHHLSLHLHHHHIHHHQQQNADSGKPLHAIPTPLPAQPLPQPQSPQPQTQPSTLSLQPQQQSQPLQQSQNQAPPPRLSPSSGGNQHFPHHHHHLIPPQVHFAAHQQGQVPSVAGAASDNGTRAPPPARAPSLFQQQQPQPSQPSLQAQPTPQVLSKSAPVAAPTPLQPHHQHQIHTQHSHVHHHTQVPQSGLSQAQQPQLSLPPKVVAPLPVTSGSTAPLMRSTPPPAPSVTAPTQIGHPPSVQQQSQGSYQPSNPPSTSPSPFPQGQPHSLQQQALSQPTVNVGRPMLSPPPQQLHRQVQVALQPSVGPQPTQAPVVAAAGANPVLRSILPMHRHNLQIFPLDSTPVVPLQTAPVGESVGVAQGHAVTHRQSLPQPPASHQPQLLSAAPQMTSPPPMPSQRQSPGTPLVSGGITIPQPKGATATGNAVGSASTFVSGGINVSIASKAQFPPQPLARGPTAQPLPPHPMRDSQPVASPSPQTPTVTAAAVSSVRPHIHHHHNIAPHPLASVPVLMPSQPSEGMYFPVQSAPLPTQPHQQQPVVTPQPHHQQSNTSASQPPGHVQPGQQYQPPVPTATEMPAAAPSPTPAPLAKPAAVAPIPDVVRVAAPLPVHHHVLHHHHHHHHHLLSHQMFHHHHHIQPMRPPHHHALPPHLAQGSVSTQQQYTTAAPISIDADDEDMPLNRARTYSWRVAEREELDYFLEQHGLADEISSALRSGTVSLNELRAMSRSTIEERLGSYGVQPQSRARLWNALHDGASDAAELAEKPHGSLRSLTLAGDAKVGVELDRSVKSVPQRMAASAKQGMQLPQPRTVQGRQQQQQQIIPQYSGGTREPNVAVITFSGSTPAARDQILNDIAQYANIVDSGLKNNSYSKGTDVFFVKISNYSRDILGVRNVAGCDVENVQLVQPMGSEADALDSRTDDSIVPLDGATDQKRTSGASRHTQSSDNSLRRQSGGAELDETMEYDEAPGPRRGAKRPFGMSQGGGRGNPRRPVNRGSHREDGAEHTQSQSRCRYFENNTCKHGNDCKFLHLTN